MMMFSNSVKGLVANLALCAALIGVARGEDKHLASSDHSHRRGDDEQQEDLRLFREQGENEQSAGPVADTLRRISAAVPLGEGDFGQQNQQQRQPQPQLHPSPEERRRTQSSCDLSSSFAITSSFYPEAEGCYFQTLVPLDDDGNYEVIYTPSGEAEVDQMWMHPDGISGLTGVGARS